MATQHELAERAWKAMPHTMGRRLSERSYKAPQHVQFISWLLYLSATLKNRRPIVPRLGISLPPGSGKSEIVDFYNPIWLLEHDARRRIILASYAGTLAEEQGKRVRNQIEMAQDVLTCRIMQDSRAADRWRTNKNGGMWTVGVGGSITGRRASNFLIDDPHKNFAEATSEKNQLDVWNWYTSTARTRLLPGSALSVIQTRWAEMDLIGRLRAQDEAKNQWLFVKLPAIAEENESTRSVLGDFWCDRLESMGVPLFEWRREEGAALWPELEPGVPWFDIEEYEQIRHEVGEMVWAGLYQQRPAPLEGEMFKRSDWVRVDSMPAGPHTMVRRWDLAASPKGDWTATCLMAYHHQTRMPYILEMNRDRLTAPEVKAWVRDTAEYDRERFGDVVHIRIEREPGSSGKNVESDYLLEVLPDFNSVKFLSSSGDKTVRAYPLSSQQGSMHVHICRRDVGGTFETPNWWQWLIEEAAAFPNAKHDDLVDVASLAWVDLVELVPRSGRARAKTTARRQLGF